MTTPPFAQVQVFLAVARLKSFSSAARELGVSRASTSQAVRTLEEALGAVLLVRTTRSVSLTDAGRRLVETAGPAFSQLTGALGELAKKPGEAIGRLRLSVPRVAVPFILEPVLPVMRARHPGIEIEVNVDDRLVDIVAGGFDAGIRLGEFLERDMLQVRLIGPSRFVVVGAPSYLKRHGAPERPDDLLRHDCIGLRSQTTGALYAWELEKGRRTFRMPVRGGIVTNDGVLSGVLAEKGLGLAYVFEPSVAASLRAGRLQRVLESYASAVPGFFLFFPKAAQRSVPLRLFIETAKELAPKNPRETA